MWGFKTRIYLDHASATPVLQKALEAVRTASAASGNPGGIHAEAVEAKRILEAARTKIALELVCKPREIVFTSGLTEANNLAILGFARALERARRSLEDTHWIVSSIEHDSVLDCFSEVERLGGSVTHVEPDERGIISAEKISSALRPETVFVSVGWGNNEIGTVQPLSRIAHAIREHEKKNNTTVIFHTDAGQAPLYLFPHVHTLGVDLFSLGSSKLYGPRGVGALYVSNRATLSPILFGGGQERGLRAGTEEHALAAGFARALEVVSSERGSERTRLQKMRDELAASLRQGFGGQARNIEVIINGDLKHALPHMLNISIPDINAEYLVLQLDREGIALSTKSACREGEADSHVVAALTAASEASAKEARSDWRARNTLRFSLGRDTTINELRGSLNALTKIIGK